MCIKNEKDVLGSENVKYFRTKFKSYKGKYICGVS